MPDRSLRVPQPPVRDKRIGLVLPGGGARGAYQVGVLKAIAEIMPRRSPNPFSVISGTSAGAISSAVLASQARVFRHAVADLERVWANFRSHHVFRCDSLTMLKSSLHWAAAVVFGGLGVGNPRALLDNTPLREMLGRAINLNAIQESIDRGYLDAVTVTAAGYDSARSVSFYQGREGYEPWDRVRRVGRPATITLDHLMASIAVPMMFPPVLIRREYFGDGAMRQATPLSPAVHLGADRLLIVGVRDEESDPAPGPDAEVPYPSMGRIAGYVLDALFMDGLSQDLERLTRVNTILENVPGRVLDSGVSQLRYIDALIILPSRDVREIAVRHVHEMPRQVQLLMSGLGALNYGGRQLVSYLLFEQGYTRELIRLGYDDALARRDQIIAFMEGAPINAPGGIAGWRDLSEHYSQKVRVLRLPGQGAAV
ncbi:MAG: patatin-like phospholipase family protein [Gammaproteobacteria bacterium]|nr:MAG: patatin-like phospholipase family protein [Gammaproteobacteria bacterium]